MITRALALGSVLASTLVLVGCKPETKAEEPVRPVLSTVLKPTAPGGTVVVGTVQPRYETNLGFRVLGRLIVRPVNVGDMVTEDQMVAAIDPRRI
jgi:membrane fusion protein, multidrug efflux system